MMAFLLALLLAIPSHYLTVISGRVRTFQTVPEGGQVKIAAGLCPEPGYVFSHWIVQPVEGGTFDDPTHAVTTFTMGKVDAAIGPACWKPN